MSSSRRFPIGWPAERPASPVRRAAVDIGTNSTRLLIAEIDAAGILPLCYREQLTRLGAGLKVDNRLFEAAMEGVLRALQQFEALIEKNSVERVRLFATSAVRDAENGAELLQRIRREIGRECRLLSGVEEARLTFLGMRGDLPQGRVLIADVGGGSTELVRAVDGRMTSLVSIDIGSSRMTDRFLIGDPPAAAEIDALRAAVRSALRRRRGPLDALVASGGTASALALIDAGGVGDPFELHGRRLTRQRLYELTAELCAQRAAERAAMFNIAPERAKVMAAGAVIYEEILDHFGTESMIISLRDALFGAVIEE